MISIPFLSGKRRLAARRVRADFLIAQLSGGSLALREDLCQTLSGTNAETCGFALLSIRDWLSTGSNVLYYLAHTFCYHGKDERCWNEWNNSGSSTFGAYSSGNISFTAYDLDSTRPLAVCKSCAQVQPSHFEYVQQAASMRAKTFENRRVPNDHATAGCLDHNG